MYYTVYVLYYNTYYDIESSVASMAPRQSKRLAVIACPGSLGSYAPFFERFIRRAVPDAEVVEYVASESELPDLSAGKYAGVIISGSKHAVYDAYGSSGHGGESGATGGAGGVEWIRDLMAWTKDAHHQHEANMLGVCFG